MEVSPIISYPGIWAGASHTRNQGHRVFSAILRRFKDIGLDRGVGCEQTEHLAFKGAVQSSEMAHIVVGRAKQSGICLPAGLRGRATVKKSSLDGSLQLEQAGNFVPGRRGLT